MRQASVGEAMQLDFVILGLLALRRFSGYDLGKWMDGPLRPLGYRVQLPQIYRRLGMLAERGWIEFDVDPRAGGQDAKVYRMTEAGRDALWTWAKSPYEPSPRPADPDFMIRFVFAGQLDRRIAIALTRSELRHREKHAAAGGAFDHILIPEAQPRDLDPHWAREIRLLSHERSFAATAAYISWLKLTLNRLERSPPG
ncbi:PadR family transcriptional regulator [Uniformispora flossi]|uniref:PadR family transcriptional regulator n=1 Tax=Uniformispora flossi TaxID=3390723 RepID=UPI003C2C0262